VPSPLALVALCLSLAGSAAEPVPTAAHTVVALRAVAGLPLRQGVAARILEAPAERVLRAVADGSHYDEWMPFVRRAAAEPLADGGLLLDQTLDLPFPAADRRYRARLDAAPAPGGGWRVEWAHLPGSGNVRDHRGSWTLAAESPGRPPGGGELYADWGLPATLAEPLLARSLPWILDGLRQQVGRCRYDRPIAAACAEEPPLLPASLGR
jgi:hypothetical protein